MTADDVTHSPPPEPAAGCVVRDSDNEFWQQVTDDGRRGWVRLVPENSRLHPLPWHRLAPFVRAVLVPLPGLAPEREPER